MKKAKVETSAHFNPYPMETDVNLRYKQYSRFKHIYFVLYTSFTPAPSLSYGISYSVITKKPLCEEGLFRRHLLDSVNGVGLSFQDWMVFLLGLV